VVKQAEKGYLIANGMAAGDVSVTVEGREPESKVSPLPRSADQLWCIL
jgi:hypothetical protein